MMISYTYQNNTYRKEGFSILDTKMENEKKYKKCNLKLDKYCGLPCPDITSDGYCKLQPLVDDTKIK
jgi:hypothetical protein